MIASCWRAEGIKLHGRERRFLLLERRDDPPCTVKTEESTGSFVDHESASVMRAYPKRNPSVVGSKAAHTTESSLSLFWVVCCTVGPILFLELPQVRVKTSPREDARVFGSTLLFYLLPCTFSLLFSAVALCRLAVFLVINAEQNSLLRPPQTFRSVSRTARTVCSCCNSMHGNSMHGFPVDSSI
jgi:hypothetical protein